MKELREAKQREQRKVKRVILAFQAIAVGLTLVFAFYVLGTFFSVNKLYVDKSALLQSFEVAISKGAELDDVKQIFDNREHFRKTFSLFSSKEDIKTKAYEEPLSLENVLRDLKSEIFLKEEPNKELVESVKTILNAHIDINPFDRLEPGQRVHFEALRSELGEHYGKIKVNVNRIVDSLDHQNQLVSKYFKDATLSFRISMIALAISFLALVPYIVGAFRRWRERLRDTSHLDKADHSKQQMETDTKNEP